MANEITIKVESTLANGQLSDKFQGSVAQVDQAVQGFASVVKDQSTTELAQPTFAEITTPGMCRIETLESKATGTQTLTWGPDSGGAMIPCGMLKPGDPPAMFRLATGTVLRFDATGAMKYKLTVYND